MELAQISGERAQAGWCCSGRGGEGRRDVSGSAFWIQLLLLWKGIAAAREKKCCTGEMTGAKSRGPLLEASL